MLFISKQELLINEEIKCREVRLVGPDGEPIGITSAADALEQAYAQNYDLVLIAPKAEPPVCKIMDYGKYRFELAKRDKENRKNQKVMSVKEIRLSPSIDNHDFETMLRNSYHQAKRLKSQFASAVVRFTTATWENSF